MNKSAKCFLEDQLHVPNTYITEYFCDFLLLHSALCHGISDAVGAIKGKSVKSRWAGLYAASLNKSRPYLKCMQQGIALADI